MVQSAPILRKKVPAYMGGASSHTNPPTVKVPEHIVFKPK